MIAAVPHVHRVLPKSDWEPNGNRTACPACQRTFSLFFRKSHCRACGRVACRDCAVLTTCIVVSATPTMAEVKLCVSCRRSSHPTASVMPLLPSTPSKCNACCVAFGLFVRRRICMCCQECFCRACAPERSISIHGAERRVTACDKCFRTSMEAKTATIASTTSTCDTNGCPELLLNHGDTQADSPTRTLPSPCTQEPCNALPSQSDLGDAVVGENVEQCRHCPDDSSVSHLAIAKEVTWNPDGVLSESFAMRYRELSPPHSHTDCGLSSSVASRAMSPSAESVVSSLATTCTVMTAKAGGANRDHVADCASLLCEDEEVVLIGTIGTTRYRRQQRLVVLTSLPRLFCVDATSKIIRSDISLKSDDFEARKVSSSTILLRSSGKNYLFDIDVGTADDWMHELDISHTLSCVNQGEESSEAPQATPVQGVPMEERVENDHRDATIDSFLLGSEKVLLSGRVKASRYGTAAYRTVILARTAHVAASMCENTPPTTVRLLSVDAHHNGELSLVHSTALCHRATARCISSSAFAVTAFGAKEMKFDTANGDLTARAWVAAIRSACCS